MTETDVDREVLVGDCIVIEAAEFERVQAENRHLRAALMKIHGHLGAAIVQRTPSDDVIIAAHIAEADAIALRAMTPYRDAVDDVNGIKRSR